MAMERRLKLVTDEETGPSETSAFKVAFATGDMTRVDQHFGAAESFALYAVDEEQASFSEALQFGASAMDGNHDKLAAKIDALDGCAAVYCLAIGASAIQRLQAKGILAVKVPRGSRIGDLIEQLREARSQGAERWMVPGILTGVLPGSARRKSPDPSRFDDMEREGWVE